MKIAKKILLALVTVCCVSTMARADDVADVRKVFDLFVQYRKTDDPRLLDLYANDVSVTLTLDTGKETRDVPVPADTFRELVAGDQAKKQGNKDTYEDLKYVQEGDTVKVTGTILYADGGKRGPFVAVYGKDAAGKFKVKALKVTVPVPQLPPGS